MNFRFWRSGRDLSSAWAKNEVARLRDPKWLTEAKDPDLIADLLGALRPIVSRQPETAPSGSRRGLAAKVALIVVLAGGFCAVWIMVPRLYGVGGASTVAQTRNGLAALLVGSGALFAGWTAWRKLMSDEAAATEVRAADARARISERFIQSVGLLSHDDEAIRLAAIHSLGEVARSSSAADSMAAIQLLSAIVRNKHAVIVPFRKLGNTSFDWLFSRRRGGPAVDPSVKYPIVRLPAEIQAALGILGGLRPELDVALDLQGADLRGAHLLNADLSGAVLRGSDLRGAVVTGCNLTGTDLTRADLRSMVLWRCRMNNHYGWSAN